VNNLKVFGSLEEKIDCDFLLVVMVPKEFSYASKDPDGRNATTSREASFCDQQLVDSMGGSMGVSTATGIDDCQQYVFRVPYNVRWKENKSTPLPFEYILAKYAEVASSFKGATFNECFGQFKGDYGSGFDKYLACVMCLPTVDTTKVVCCFLLLSHLFH